MFDREFLAKDLYVGCMSRAEGLGIFSEEEQKELMKQVARLCFLAADSFNEAIQEEREKS